MRRIKVFYLITGLHIGGAERLLLDTVKELDRERYQPVVATLVGGNLIPHFEAAGVRVYDLNMKKKWDVKAFLRLKRIIEEERPDILHTHLFHADLIGRILGKVCQVPIILTTLHMLEFTRAYWYYNWPDRWASRFNDALIAVSQAVKDGFVDKEKLDESKITVIQNGVTDLPEVTEQELINTRMRMTQGPGPVVGIVSRLDIPRKGHPVLFEAIQRLKEKYPTLICAVVGSGTGYRTLQEDVRRLGLEAHVVFLGAQDNVAPWLKAMDVFALPSRHEGFPMAIIEAMAAQKPIVATPVGGVADLIEHEKTGLLVPVGDAKALAEAIERLLDQKELAAGLAQAARDRFENQFAMSTLVKRTEALYAEWVDRKLNAPVKLLEVTTCLDSGGVTSHLLDLLDQLPKDQFDVSVAAAPEEDAQKKLEAIHVKFHAVPMVKPIQPVADLKALWSLFRLMKREKIEMVHAHMAKAGFLASVAAKWAGVPCMISTIHGPTRVTLKNSWKQTLFEILDKWSLSKCHDHAISVSHATTADLLRSGKISQNRIVTLHNGIDTKRLKTKHSREEVRAALGLDATQPVVTMVGRLADQKSQETLIHAMCQLQSDWPKAVCLLIGDGPRFAEFKSMISRYQLESSVRLLGQRDDVTDLLNASDVFVLCTKFEGLSIAVLEAMALGLPVVATNVEGMEELIIPNETGMLIGDQDVTGCVQALEALFNDAALRKRMGETAQLRVAEHFRLDAQMQSTSDVLLKAAHYKRMWRGRSKAPSGGYRFKLYIHETGFKETCVLVAKRLMSVLSFKKDLWFYHCDLAQPLKRLRSISACTIRQAGPQDARALAQVSFESQDMLGALLTSPHEACFVSECDATKLLGADVPRKRPYATSPIMAYQWIVLGPRNVEIMPFGRILRLGPKDAYFYNCRTMKDFQGKGVGALVELKALEWLKEQGYENVYTDIRPDNVASCRMFSKLGFKRIERIRLTKTLKKRTVENFYPRLKYEEDRLRVSVVQDHDLDGHLLDVLRPHVDIKLVGSEHLDESLQKPADIIFSVGFKPLVRAALVAGKHLDRFTLTTLITRETFDGKSIQDLGAVKKRLLVWALKRCSYVWFSDNELAQEIKEIIKIPPRQFGIWSPILRVQPVPEKELAGAAAVHQSQWTWEYGRPDENTPEQKQAISEVIGVWRNSLEDVIVSAHDGRWSQADGYQSF